MKTSFTPIRLFVEVSVAVTLAETLVLLVLPVLAPSLNGLAEGFIGVALLILLSGPVVYWRCMAAMRRPRAATGAHEGARAQTLSIHTAIGMTAAAQFAGLAVTGAIVAWLKLDLDKEAQIQFDRGAERIEAEVKRRFNQPLLGLKGARGAFAANKYITRREFNAYVAAHDLPNEFGGIRGLGFITRVQRSDLDAFVAAEQADFAPEFAVRSRGDATDLFVIKYIEPLVNNWAAFGFDIGQEAVRREAAERAVNTGQPALTGKITLVQDGNQSPGFLYILPVYRPGTDPVTVAQHQAALVGLLYAPIVATELFEDLVDVADNALRIEVLDGNTLSPNNSLFDSDATRNGAPPSVTAGLDRLPVLSVVRPIAVGGRTLSLRVSSTPAFHATQDRTSLALASLAGALASLLLALTVWLLAVGRLRAQRLAERMTADLDRLARVVQHTTNAVTIADTQMRITWVNEGFTRLTGYSLEDARGKTPGELLGSGKTNPQTIQKLVSAVAMGEPCRVEVLNRAKDGHEYWADTEVQPTRDADGVLIGFMEIGTDVTVQKQTQKRLEAAIRESTTLLSTVALHNIVSVTDRQGTIIDTNDAFSGISGYSREELIGQNHRIVKSGMQPDQFWNDVWAVISTGASWRGDICNRAKDGSLYWVDSMIVPFIGDDGLVEKYVSMRTDITERKHNEHQLAEVTKRMTLAIEGGSDGLWDWMDVHQDAQWWAPNYYALLGYNPQDIPALASSYVALLHPDSREPSLKAGQDALAGLRPFDVEVQLQTKDQGYRWFRTRAKVYFDDQGRAARMSGATQDIHDHKLAQDALKESEAFLDRAGRIAGVGGWSVQLKTRKIHWSKETRRIHEVDDSYEPQLDQAIHFYATEARPVIERAVRDGMERGIPWDLELPFITAKGRSIWVRAVGEVEFKDGKPDMLIGAFQDITERRARDEDLHLLESCITRIKDSILITRASPLDEPGPEIVFANRAFETLTGYSQAEIRGRNPRMLQGPDTDRAALTRIRNAISRGESVSEELLNYTKDGTPYWIEVSISPVMTESGEVSHFVAVERDVTERRRHDAALRDAVTRAQQASVAKSQFVANMSHEIRTPMNAILGMLKLLQNTDLTVRQLDYAAKTEGAARSLLGLLNDILDYSKVEAGKMTLDPRPFHLDRLMRDLSVILSASIGTKNIEVLFDIDPAVPKCLFGDDMRLQQVLINLGGNAIKFTSAGEVVLHLRLVEQTAQDVLVEFAMQDSGIGIAPENRAHIFSGFSQAEASTTRRFGGTGLGLAISSRMVGLLGGTLAVDSVLGQGSSFHFQIRFPRAEMPPAELPAAPLEELGALKTLIVDDNAITRDVLRHMVQAMGWQADTVSSGAQAIAHIEACANDKKPPYEVIFMDWQMPQMDGWEASQRIRKLEMGAVTPIVVMVTAHGREMLSQRSADEHALINGFLVKPVTASMLLDAVVDAKSAAMAAAQGQNPTAPKAIAQPKRLQGLRILVVEDNKINQMVAKGLLAQEGATVTLADNGQLGVAAVAAEQPAFDAVLMDIQMPVMDGYAATRVIRQELGLMTLPIIAMTANAMASDRAACLAAGMDDHVGKPFELDHLVGVLLRLCAPN